MNTDAVTGSRSQSTETLRAQDAAPPLSVSTESSWQSSLTVEMFASLSIVRKEASATND